MNPLKPDAKLLCKLGSIVIHIEELISSKGHPYDKSSLLGLLADEDINNWLTQMDKLALIPKKR